MVKFKDEKTVLYVNGLGRVHQGNITPGLYETLLKINPRYEEYFEGSTEEPKEEKKASSKTKSKINESDSQA